MVHEFSKDFGKYLIFQFPKLVTLQQRKDFRENKVFLDFSRNDYGLSTIAPYSLRDKDHAPIATPLHWDELNNSDLSSQSFTLRNIFQRLQEVSDPWGDMDQKATSLDQAHERLRERMLGDSC